ACRERRGKQGGAKKLQEGGRNGALASLAGSMRQRGMREEAIEAALLVENAARCEPALSEDEVRAIARSIAQYPSGDEAGGVLPPYFEHNGAVHLRKMTKEGTVSVPLCNFTARIVGEVVYDDGAEQTRRLAVEGSLAGGMLLPRAEIMAADFA